MAYWLHETSQSYSMREQHHSNAVFPTGRANSVINVQKWGEIDYNSDWLDTLAECVTNGSVLRAGVSSTDAVCLLNSNIFDNNIFHNHWYTCISYIYIYKHSLTNSFSFLVYFKMTPLIIWEEQFSSVMMSVFYILMRQ